ncbi:MAG: flagellin FliC [Halobacteriovoraceae bacterium]|nr:flagellin FliC [Halobacteriovoraceae bacterium]MCB9094004.1 flagellin FliC [Halobacteriovoraceae bacterium]
MGFRINTNVASIAAQKALKMNNRDLESNLGKLSSGTRIVKSADDAAGLAISEKMKGHISSLKQAGRNANDGISMVQVAEGGFVEIGNMLNRLRELSIQSASDTVGDNERSYIDMEYQNLKKEIQRIAESTDFNGKKLLNGEGDKFDFQVGIHNNDFQDRISYNAQSSNVTVEALGIDGLSASSKEGAQDGLASIDEAISIVNENRAELGALQNRLTVTTNNIENAVENLSAANSRIRDLDYAEASADNAKVNVINSAATSVLAQANLKGQNALKLLG